LTSDIASRANNLISLWGGVFYHPAFVESGATALGLDGRSEYISSEKLSGISNILYHRLPKVRVATLPLLFQYFGPIAFNPISNHSEQQKISFLPPDNLDYAYFSLPPGADLSLMPQSWHAVQQRTLVVDKNGLNQWGNSFRDDVKNKIRKARRERVVISIADRLPLDLWGTAYSRKSLRTPIAPTALEKWCDKLIAAKLLTIHIASIDSRPVAFRGELQFGDYAYDWIAGSDPEFHSTGANQLLVAEIGGELAKLNLSAWDLVGGEVERIAEFKKSFGAVEAIHHHVWGATSMKGRIYSAVRKLRYGIFGQG
jgi:hypothetical protein